MVVRLPGRDAARRLLLISYHFPPSSTAGALRWEKLAAIAVDRGWGLDVVTLDPKELETEDRGRLERLPQEVGVYGVGQGRLALDALTSAAARWYRRLARGRAAGQAPPGGTLPAEVWVPQSEVSFRPLAASDYLRAYRAWMLWEREGRWAAAASRAAEGLFEPALHRAIISCGPPHICHVAAARVATTEHVPHIVDMRDPWSLLQRLPTSVASPVWNFRARRYERRVLRRATLVVMNTERARQAMVELYPALAPRLVTVMNGCDQDGFTATPVRDRFRIAYAGTIYIDRDPGPLLEAVGRVVRSLRLSPDQISVEFMGEVLGFGGRSLEDIARQAGVAGYVRLHAAAPRRAALEFLASAPLLVSLPQDSDLAIPSKVFEYMQFPAWILALAREGSATEVLLRTSAADVVPPDDVNRLAAVLERRYLQYQRGERPAALAADDRFSRRAQADILFTAIERIVGPPVGAGSGTV